MEIIYVIAISLQVCGAIVLLIGSYGKTEIIMANALADKLDRAVLSGIRITDIDITNEIRNMYLSRISLVYLALGYVLGVFGEICATSKLIMAVIIVLVSIILTVLTYLVSGRFAFVRQDRYKKTFEQ